MDPDTELKVLTIIGLVAFSCIVAIIIQATQDAKLRSPDPIQINTSLVQQTAYLCVQKYAEHWVEKILSPEVLTRLAISNTVIAVSVETRKWKTDEFCITDPLKFWEGSLERADWKPVLQSSVHHSQVCSILGLAMRRPVMRVRPVSRRDLAFMIFLLVTWVVKYNAEGLARAKNQSISSSTRMRMRVALCCIMWVKAYFNVDALNPAAKVFMVIQGFFPNITSREVLNRQGFDVNKESRNTLLIVRDCVVGCMLCGYPAWLLPRATFDVLVFMYFLHCSLLLYFLLCESQAWLLQGVLLAMQWLKMCVWDDSSYTSTKTTETLDVLDYLQGANFFWVGWSTLLSINNVVFDAVLLTDVEKLWLICSIFVSSCVAANLYYI